MIHLVNTALRTEQTALTRTRIIDAVFELLAEGHPAAIDPRGQPAVGGVDRDDLPALPQQRGVARRDRVRGRAPAGGTVATRSRSRQLRTLSRVDVDRHGGNRTDDPGAVRDTSRPGCPQAAYPQP